MAILDTRFQHFEKFMICEGLNISLGMKHLVTEVINIGQELLWPIYMGTYTSRIVPLFLLPIASVH
jgi:hypothetical protein